MSACGGGDASVQMLQKKFICFSRLTGNVTFLMNNVTHFSVCVFETNARKITFFLQRVLRYYTGFYIPKMFHTFIGTVLPCRQALIMI